MTVLTNDWVSIDAQQLAALGESALLLKPAPDFAVKVCPALNASDEDAFRAFFWAAAICHSTKGGLRGTFDGAEYKGWDFLLRAFAASAEHDASAIAPEAVRSITDADLRTILIRHAQGPQVTLPDLDRRAEILRDTARELHESYDDRVSAILTGSENRVGGVTGAYARLESIGAFGDALRKKSTAFLMAVHYSGRWSLLDHENVFPMIDYHRLRLLLRTGVLKISDSEMRGRLARQERVPDAFEEQLRAAAEDVCRSVVKQHGIPMFDFDVVLWAHARSCCRHAPICQGAEPENLSFYEYVGRPLTSPCVFASWCRGVREEKIRSLWEPNIPTEHY